MNNNKEKGLTGAQVRDREKRGLVNGNFSVKTKSVGQIIFTNLFTLFNFVNLSLAVCLILVHSYKNIMFLGVVMWNVFIGVVQEIRSKKIIDKLSLLSAPSAMVVRDGQEDKIKVEDIVLGDTILLKSGNQICVDSIITKGQCEVNESLLTGESDPVFKKEGDEILSGSYLISGAITTEAIRVGKENYVNKITSQAKYLKRPNSEILKSIKLIIKGVSIILFPIGFLLFLNQLEEQAFNKAVVSGVAGVLGMIPSGLVLLTSVVLAVSVIRLGKRNTLVQELYCIETLARVDTLCLDKTGTITEGTMSVEKVIPLREGEAAKKELNDGLRDFTEYLDDDNTTFDALCRYVRENIKDNTNMERDNILEEIRFSSDKKWSLVELENKGVLVLGALEFLFKEPDENLKNMVTHYAKKGLRVLVFARAESGCTGKKLPKNICPMGIIALSDTIREEAVDTFKYFINQGVNIKVISGDNPVTVSYVAEKAGILNADKYVDGTLLSTDEDIYMAAEEYTVFGRVTPAQKLLLVKALKEKGHTVAMTGDGVNDVMALKEADCSIAMQSGSDAARNVSQLVLMDSNFSSMPAIVAEGRRTINNLQRSASLYLTKTMYSFVLALLFVILPSAYPFIPIQLTFIGSLSIGIPSFILAMEPNVNRVKGKFIVNVLKMSLPGAALVVTNIVAMVIFKFIFRTNNETFSTMCLYGLAIAALLQLFKCCIPFNKLRYTMCWCLIGLFIFGTTFFKDLLSLESMNFVEGVFVIGIIFSSIILYGIYVVIVGKIMGNAPNVYKIHLLLMKKKGIVLVDEDVERKDYYDVAAQIGGLKVLKADRVAYIGQPIKGGDIRIETAEKEDNPMFAAVAARYYIKKNKIKDEKFRVLVETDFADEPMDIYIEDNAVNDTKIRYLRRIKVTF